jgi:hypothetical protein
VKANGHGVAETENIQNCYGFYYLHSIVKKILNFCVQILFLFSEEILWNYSSWCKWKCRHFQQYFSYIMATSFSGGRSRSTRREPPTMGKQLVNLITCGCESSAPFFVTKMRPQYLPNNKILCKLHSTIVYMILIFFPGRGRGWLNELGSWIT